jgi:hypothetical protein
VTRQRPSGPYTVGERRLAGSAQGLISRDSVNSPVYPDYPQVAGGDEQRAVAGEHGGVDDVLGDHRLTEPLRGDQDDVVRALDEAEGQDALDRLKIPLKSRDWITKLP